MNEKLKAPSTGKDFDKAYSLPVTIWGDVRIPGELKELVKQKDTNKVLELGCGLGRFSSYVAKQGLSATAVDFSQVAIDRARKRTAKDSAKPDFIVADVTKLSMISGPFDASFDIGCFHCLTKEEQQKYAAEAYRLLKKGGTHLIWAIDHAPSDIALNESVISGIFNNGFALRQAKASRRRIVKSHWYWLVRK